MNRIKVLLFLTILAFAANLNAQTLKAYQKTLKNALDSGEYATALNTYKVILDDASKGETQMYYDAANLAHDLTVYEMAERYYLQVIESEAAASFPLTNFRLGMVQKSLGKYSAADSSFQRYIAANTSADDVYLAKAKKEREDCIWAQEQLQNAQDLDIERKDSIVNTSCHTEIAPFYNEGQLYFTTVREEENPNATNDDPIHQIFSTVGDSIAIRLTDGFNKTGTHTGHTAFSSDGSRLFFTICDGKQVDRLRCHIYYKEKGDNGIWGEEVKLSDQINLDSFTSTQPNIAMDGDQELLFFSSDRPGGKGGLDIWCSVREANGEFGAPFNIQQINTAEDDMTPFYHSKTHNLYFSSNGRQNMGGFDTYKSRKKDMSWGDVQHMGAPVNGSYDDVFYTVSDETGMAYFSSNRPATVCDDYPIEGPICSDIYYYEVPRVDMDVLTYSCGKELPGCVVTLVDLSTNDKLELPTVGNRAEYALEYDRDYLLIAQKENHKGDTIQINTSGLDNDDSIEKRLELEPYINLSINTINSLRSTALLGAEITVLNITLNKIVSPNSNSGSSRFPFTLAPGYRYKITAKKDCFNPASTVVSTIDPCLPNPLAIDLNLKPGFQSPPVVLFFDNDRPNRRTMDTVATVDYKQTFDAYMIRKGMFQGALQSFSNELALITTFFQDSVQTGFDSLELFTTNLLEYLKCNDDTKVEVIIQGYASPLSYPDYNLNLTKRRVDCVKKYFAGYGTGELGDFMRGDESRLKVRLVPNGDKKAIGGKNDRNDKVNSIYNVAASRERRVEIIRVDITENN